MASNGFADVMIEKRFAGVAVPGVVPIDACEDLLNAPTLMVLYLMCHTIGNVASDLI